MKPAVKNLVAIILISLFYFSPIIVSAQQVDINTATLSELDALAGIGPVYAQRIIDGRPYTFVDDLLKVQGIGETTLEKIKAQGLACVDCPTSTTTQGITQPQTTTPATTSQSSEGQYLEDGLPADASFQAMQAGTPNIVAYPGGILINEIMPSPQGSDAENEWIELFNSNNFPVDLSDWQIKDKIGSTKTYTFSQAIMNPNGFFVLKRPESKITLQNTEDGLILLDPTGKVVDEVDYASAKTGQSYCRTENNAWAWSTTPTPNSYNAITLEKVSSGAKNSSQNQTSTTSNAFISQEEKMLADIAQNPRISKNNWIILIIGLIIATIATTTTLLIRAKINHQEQYFT